MIFSRFQQSLFSRAQGFALATVLGLSAAGLWGCNTATVSEPQDGLSQGTTDSTASSGATAIAGEQLQIVTTFLPITNFTQAVAGDRAQVTQLLPPGIGPHDYQAKPQDARAIARADMLIGNGLEFEAFLDDLIANAGNEALKVIDSSEGIEIAEEEAAETDSAENHGAEDHGAEDHGAEDHGAENHTENHAEEQGSASEAAHDDHNHGGVNPHIWLDPKMAIQQVENIRDALISADPAGEAVYAANATAYIDKLRVLDSDITTALAPYKGKTFVTYHDFAEHFANSYGLNVSYMVNVPEGSASPADVRRVIEVAQKSNLKTLLSEPQQADNPFDAIAKDLGVQVSIFDPMETSGSEGLSPDHYFTVMNQNLKNLEAAFGKAAP
jgi:zinc transport system substrate-binding protein